MKKRTSFLLSFCFIWLYWFQLSLFASQKIDRVAEIVVDVETGRILHDYKSDHIRHPASLTKLMTLYMMFEALDNGRFMPDSRITFSRFSASRPPSKLGIRPGGSITFRDASYTLIIRSANDVAVAVAETLSGSESAFATAMTRKARQLGMTKTLFKNASGLPDKNQITSAKDMAILALRLMQHYPHYYKYFSTLNKTVASIPLRTHNHLLKTYSGMDGLKTGFVNMSGFNLVSSATRNNKRLITVVMGGNTYRERDNRVVQLTDIGWQRLNNPRGYSRFIGTSMPQLALLKTSFRPLEMNQNNKIMTASLVRQRAIVSPQKMDVIKDDDYAQIQKIEPAHVSQKAALYHLKNISPPDKGGWKTNANITPSLPQAGGTPVDLPAQAESLQSDQIADLIQKSHGKQRAEQLQNYDEAEMIDDPLNFKPIPIDKALKYKTLPNGSDKKIPSSSTTSLASASGGGIKDQIRLQARGWYIQVGAFSRKVAADNYMSALMKKYDNFSQATPSLEKIKKGDDTIYRARFTGMDSTSAKKACFILNKMGRHCIILSEPTT